MSSCYPFKNFTTNVHASDFEYTCPVKCLMRTIFQRFNPQNTTTGISHLLFLPCWPFVLDRCRHRHIIHPLDNTIVLWSETGTVRTSGSANHGIFTFTLELVLSLWPLQSLTPKTDRKGDTIFQCNFSPISVYCFWPASTLLHGHIALANPSLPETDPQILEHWGYADEDHLGKSFQEMDFGLEC